MAACSVELPVSHQEIEDRRGLMQLGTKRAREALLPIRHIMIEASPSPTSGLVFPSAA